MGVGFAGGVVVDYPNSTKAKKHYLVLTFDRAYKAPQGLADGSLMAHSSVRVDRQTFTSKKRSGKGQGKKGGGKTKDWIVHKKEGQRKQGKSVRPDTKYTGRKRR